MQTKFRQMSSMVVYQLETALGDFVVNKSTDPDASSPTANEIITRELDRGNECNTDRLSFVVESSYLDEVFRLAAIASEGTTSNDYVRYLRSICDRFDLFAIRNAVSHPNRPFPETYWYRVAAIATDPVIEKLNLLSVIQAFHAALAGKLFEPPEGWFRDADWSIPNNLPATFDHEITGLVGRQKEWHEIRKILRNPRLGFVAVVAPGGIGKTALLLDLLGDICSSPESHEWIDAVTYTTLKQEELTAAGVQSLPAAATMDQLEADLVRALSEQFAEDFKDFSNACELLEKKRILFCLDNLETILVDDPQSIVEFVCQLPPLWKVVITSRIPVESAMIFSLPALDPQASVHLARTYAQRRGLPRLETETLRRIAEECQSNPLAIRLTVDKYVMGGSIDESIESTKGQIAEFSFSRLIDSLSDTAIRVLECLFISDRLPRLEVVDIIQESAEEVAQSIYQLSKTSLVTRVIREDVEEYSISSAVRDLVRRNPRNLLYREEVQQRARERRSRILQQGIRQKRIGASPFDLWYVPDGLPDSLNILLSEANKVIWRKESTVDKVAELDERFKEQVPNYRGYGIFCKYYGQILTRLKDYGSAEKYLKEAVRLGPDDPTSLSLLAIFYSKAQRYEEAEELFRRISKQGWMDTEVADEVYARVCVNGFLFSLLYQGKHGDVLEETKDWKKNGVLSPIYGSFRAGAWKRHTEVYVGKDVNEVERGMHSAMRILIDVYTNWGFTRNAVKVGKNVVEEIAYEFAKQDAECPASKYSVEYRGEALTFAKFFFDNVGMRDFPARQRAEAERVFKDVVLPDNPFTAGETKVNSGFEVDRFSMDGIKEKELEKKGFRRVEIYYLPVTDNDMPSYVFGRDPAGEEFFIHRHAVEEGQLEAWFGMRVGDTAWVLADDKSDGGRATPARRIVFY